MKGSFLIRCLCLAGAVIWTGSGVAVAQTESPASISAKRNLVLVPALVYDKDRMDRALGESEKQCVVTDLEAFRNLSRTEPYLPKACDETPIRGLALTDFHVFEDGIEQKIQSATAGSWGVTVRDNYAWHAELSLTPAGRWSTSELRGPLAISNADARSIFGLPWIFGLDAAGPLYWIAYVPSKPNAAGCRKVEVKVDRRKARVFAWNESCAGQSATDPLVGTKLGNQIEEELVSGKHGNMELLVEAGSLHRNGDEARVNVVVELPFGSLDHDWKMNRPKRGGIGLSGIVYKKDGTLVARFSDLACCSSFSPVFGPPQPPQPGEHELPGAGSLIDDYLIPARYETQIGLPPGEYDLKVVLDDGEKFGRVEVPLEIDSYDGKGLGLSSVMLCKRFRDAHVAAVERAAANFAPQYVPLVSKGIELTPTGDTRLKKGEPLIPYFEVYEPLLTTPPATGGQAAQSGGPVIPAQAGIQGDHSSVSPSTTLTVEAHIRIVDATTGQLVKDFPPVDAAPYERAGSSMIPIAREIPFDQLPKGAYRLEVQATDSAGRSTPWRTADFTVE